MVISGHLIFLVTDLPFANILRPLNVDILVSLSGLNRPCQLVSSSVFVYFLQGVVTFHCYVFHDRLRKYNVNFTADRVPNSYGFYDDKIRSSIASLTFSTWSNYHSNSLTSQIKSTPVDFDKSILKM